MPVRSWKDIRAALLPLFIKVPEDTEDEVSISLPKIREAQKITGELLWLSGKTRPDLS